MIFSGRTATCQSHCRGGNTSASRATCRRSSPLLVRRGTLFFRLAREQPAQIGKAVEITENFGVRVGFQARHSALRAATDGAGEIERGGQWRVTRHGPAFAVEVLVFLQFVDRVGEAI